MWNKRLLRYDETDKHVVLHFEDGTQAEVDLVVGADGEKSVVRSQRCPQLKLEDAHVVNIGGISPYPSINEGPCVHSLLGNSMVRVFGNNGSSLLFMPWLSPTNERKLIWVLTQADDVPGARDAATATSSQVQVHEFCVRQADEGQFHPEVCALVANAHRDQFIRGGRLYSIMWSPSNNPLGTTTRVTLLGDAAHAMTTHMGMGTQGT